VPVVWDGRRKEISMLVTFTCKAYADITMFGDVAVSLLKLMGHSGTVPGALVAAEVPQALERLRAGIAAHGDTPAPASDNDSDRDEPVIRLSLRALPLVELLEAAVRDECDGMWDR
jgi:hypothetical protein